MRKTKAILAAVTAGSMVFGLAACGGGSSAYQTTTAAAAAETTAAAAADTAAAGGAETTAAAEASGEASTEDLKIMMETPVESLDPQQATDGTSFEVIADYTDGLMQMDADGKAVNAIAESYETSDDGLTWTFHLRQDAKWSNGTPVTAKDFVFGWQRAVDPDVASEYAYMLSDIGQVKNAQDIIDGKKDKSELGVTAVDDYTLKVELNAPVSYFLSLMYFPTYYPVNEEFFNTCADTFGTSP
ncbi:MAG: ABC transporter substrate-binding protein, partial [Oribacterium sp.]|nr:ABC transporter substrate-binding protein [Oribacterium sp.]